MYQFRILSTGKAYLSLPDSFRSHDNRPNVTVIVKIQVIDAYCSMKTARICKCAVVIDEVRFSIEFDNCLVVGNQFAHNITRLSFRCFIVTSIQVNGIVIYKSRRSRSEFVSNYRINGSE